MDIEEGSFSPAMVEEHVYQMLLGRFRLWRSHGLVDSIRAVRIEQRRGLVASWVCELAPYEACERLLLLDVEDFARAASLECGLPDPTIWWIYVDPVTHVRVAFSEQPFDA